VFILFTLLIYSEIIICHCEGHHATKIMHVAAPNPQQSKFTSVERLCFSGLGLGSWGLGLELWGLYLARAM